MSLQRRIERRNKGLKVVRAGTAAVVVGAAASSSLITLALEHASDFQPDTVEQSTSSEWTPTVISVDYSTPTKKPKAKPTPSAPTTPPAPAPRPTQSAKPAPKPTQSAKPAPKPSKSHGS